MTQFYNPVAGVYLVYPVEQEPEYHRYCQTGGREPIDQSPFGRMVDLWFAGLSIAARRGLSPIDLSGRKTSNMVQGAIFDRDSWRIQFLMLVTIAIEDDVAVVEHPNRMIAIANGLAAAGVPYVVEMLQRGEQLPIWNLTDALATMLEPGE